MERSISKPELNDIYTKLVASAINVLAHFNSFNLSTYFVFGNIFGTGYDAMKKNIKDFDLDIPDFIKQQKALKNTKNIGLKNIDFKDKKIAGLPYYDSFD